MARQRRVSRAELLRQACEENYDGFGTEQIKEEIARISKVNFSLIQQEPVHLTISVGVAEYRDGDDALSFIKRADKGMYKAKNQGKNCSFFNKEIV